MSTAPTKLYRVALYGRSKSGKTCLLTALAMPRVAHPGGLSCSWVPEPSGVRDAATVAAYRRGREVIEACRLAMSRGDKPLSTDPSPDFPRFRFHFTTLSPCPHTYGIELIDYAGELIDPSTRAPQLAAQLRRRISTGEVDAVLVLAEAPRPGQEVTKLFEEFELLKQAFATLGQQGARRLDRHIPVGLLLNKWDRRHPADGTPRDREREVADYLGSQSRPPQADLINALRGAVPENCFHAFAVSAFGAARLAQLTDAEGRTVVDAELPPSTIPLPSFGLEDAFVWAAQQRDALDRATVLERSEALRYASSSWLYFNVLATWAPWGVWRRAWEVSRRLPRKDEHLPHLRAARRRAGRIASVRTLVTLLAAVFIGLLMVASHDVSQRRQITSNLELPDRTAEQVAADENWLANYESAPAPYRWLSFRFFSRDEAGQLLQRSRDRRDRDLWAKVDVAQDDTAKEAPTLAYLSAFPNGKHRTEANQVLQRAEDTRNMRDNQSHLDTIARDLATHRAKLTLDADVLRQLDQQLQHLPHPAQVTKEQFEQRRRLNREVIDTILTAGKQHFREKYAELMDGGHVIDAGRLLLAQKEPPQELLDSYPTQAIFRVEKEYRRCVSEKNWAGARELIDPMSNADPAIINLIPAEQQKQLTRWKQETDKGEDRELYDQLRRYRDLSRIERYLDTAPLKKMRKEAEAYREYLRQIQGELELTLHLSKIEWGDVWGGKTEYQLALNDRTIMEGSVTATKNATSEDIDQAKIKLRLDDEVNIDIKKFRHIGKVKNTDYGTPGTAVKVRNLNNVIMMDISHDPPTTFYFALDGIPPAPSLPPYQEN